jgi:hypothetical protein
MTKVSYLKALELTRDNIIHEGESMAYHKSIASTLKTPLKVEELKLELPFATVEDALRYFRPSLPQSKGNLEQF